MRGASIAAVAALALFLTGCGRTAQDPNEIRWPASDSDPGPPQSEVPLATPRFPFGPIRIWGADGALSNGEAELAFFDAAGRPVAFADKELYNDSVPIARSHARIDSIDVQAIAFVPAQKDSPDTTAWVLVLVEMTNRQDHRARAELRVAVRTRGDSARYVRRAGRVLRDGRVLALYDDAEGPVLLDPRTPAAPAIARGGSAEVGEATAPDHFAAGAHYAFQLEPGRSVWLRFALAPPGGVRLGEEPTFPRLNRGKLFAQTLEAWGARAP
ncbi:MAG: hypothetical protein ACREOU_01200 [Candidatus Eiseniibacteriota bacterium]